MSDLDAVLRAMRALMESMVRDEVKRALSEPQDEYLTTSLAAKSAKVAVGTIRRWIKEGKLAAHRTGRTLRVRRGELEDLLKTGRARNDDSPEALARRMFG